jgi:polar amino acid transport system ATP-binding protein
LAATADVGSTPPDTDAADGPGEPIVVFRKVSKSFGDVHVLRELDFEVAPNENIAIIGPSGSGKTTILRILMTLVRPDSGEVIVDGRHLFHKRVGDRLVPADERHLHEVRKNIGMVFQHFNLFPHMKVLRNVTEAPIHVLGLSRSEAVERATGLLELVGLGDKLDAFPGQLSGGQKQRVAIARALAMRPKVMLFDEVTSALDPELVGEVLGIIRQLAKDGEMAMLIVTHEMGFARDVADRVVFFDAGQVAEQGPPGEISTAPKNPRTQEFLRAVLEH